jgi:tetratricopeptide (TPR) repeat protein
MKTIFVTGLTAVVLFTGCSTGSKKPADTWNKTSARIKLPLAQQQFEAGNFSEAEKSVVELLKNNNAIPEAHLLLGKILLVQAHEAKALEEISLALKYNEKLDQAWYLLGLIDEEKNDINAAQVNIARACSLAPENDSYAAAMVRIHVSKSEYEKAASFLESSMNQAPRNARLKYLYAQLLQRQNKLKEAQNYYEQARILSPDEMEISEALGCCYILSSKWPEAAQLFETAANNCNDPDKKNSYIELAATCSMNSRQYAKAARTLDNIAAQQRDNPDLWLKMGQAALGSGSASRALTCAQRALNLRPGFTEAVVLKGSSHFMLKNYSECIKSFQEVLNDRTNTNFAWFMIGKCLQRQGEFEKAKQAFANARNGADNLLAQELAKLAD